MAKVTVRIHEKKKVTLMIKKTIIVPGEGGSELVGIPDLPVDHHVEDCQEEEGDQVEEDQVHPVDIDLNNINL